MKKISNKLFLSIVSITIFYKRSLLLAIIFFHTTFLVGQNKILSLQQQNEDFTILTESLKEGHAGLYHYIDKKTFQWKCDSLRNTFRKQEIPENFYLKLRFLISCLHHGHTRIELSNQSGINYKMRVLDTSKYFLPFEFFIIKRQLVIKADCSREQLFEKYAIVKSINGISAENLIQKMLPYMPADGVNESFKLYTLYNYFHFHHLFNLFFPEKKGIKIEIAGNKTHYYIELLKPNIIDSIYYSKNKKGISQYAKQLKYQSEISSNTAYLKIGSFYKGLIEQFGQQYNTFIDSAFADLARRKTGNLILDLRNNEGGGDGYDNILLAHLISNSVEPKTVIKVPGRRFTYNEYTFNLSEDVRMFIKNPAEFLENDSSLFIKKEYTDMMIEGKNTTPLHKFNGRLIVLTNGGSFSAANTVIGALYFSRKQTGRKILFVGEENGGDIYSRSICAGQGYTIKLPNSSIMVDMPFLCFGEINTKYPRKRIPDYTVYDSVKTLSENKDKVLDFALHYFLRFIR